ncbi:hypothetical protein ACFFVB_12440 [Formosa undariae]|uniref:Uncharacterized protein n=1 Tax=Formosa undariae TaxID=1325436 RepID=A0ABV5F367_9FLAO
MKTHRLTILGIIINTLITAFIYFTEDYKGLDIIMIIALVICYIGFIVMQFNQAKIGSIIFCIGSAVFIPIGLVGIIGVRKTVQNIEDEEFYKAHYE